MLPVSYFEHFREAIFSLPLKEGKEKYDRSELICSRFLLFREADLEIYYTPFHHLNTGARLVLLGLPPGWTQMEEAFRAARSGLSLGLEGQRLFEHIDRTGSFSGPMRKNLVQMLDGIDLDRLLGIASCTTLFDTSRLVHFTSAVSAPIFRRGENYRGYGPFLLRVTKLREWIVQNLATELAAMPKAVIVPLGMVATEAIQFLESQNAIGSNHRCLIGFPHPSGANGHRKAAFSRGRQRWRDQLAAWFADATAADAGSL